MGLSRIGHIELSAANAIDGRTTIAVGNNVFVTSGDSPSVLYRVRLSSFEYIDSLTFPAGSGVAYAAVSDGTYIYYGCAAAGPSKIIRIRVSDFSYVDTLTLNSGENQIESAAIDTVNGFAYFGTHTNPGIVVKVQLSDFTRVGALTLNAGEATLLDAVIDTVAGFVYFGTSNGTGNLVKVQLSDFTRVGAIVFLAAESQIDGGAVIDIVGGYAYFATHTSSGAPTQVVKVRLSDFTRVGACSLGGSMPINAAFDSVNHNMYVITTTDSFNPASRVYKIRLVDFVVEEYLNLIDPDEDSAGSLTVVPTDAGPFVYAAAASVSTPLRVIKIDSQQTDTRQLIRGDASARDGQQRYLYGDTVARDGYQRYLYGDASARDGYQRYLYGNSTARDGYQRYLYGDAAARDAYQRYLYGNASIGGSPGIYLYGDASASPDSMRYLYGDADAVDFSGALSSAFLASLKTGYSHAVTIIEITLDAGVWGGAGAASRWGTFSWGEDGTLLKWGTHGVFSDVIPILQSVSSLQNKLDTKSGFSTRGQVSFSITGRDNFKNLLKDEYLKNRRVVVRQGFIAPGFTYADYAEVFAGRVTDWTRKGDELTITASDDLIDAAKKIPEENSTKTQYADYRNMNPADIMKDILLTKLGIGAAYVDEGTFDTERDNWLNGWKFDRVITEPKAADEYLNELQIETNSFLIHDNMRIVFKVFAPPVPGQAIEEWTDGFNIQSRSFSEKSGYKDNFFNRVVLYFDYDESGSDKEENFESAVIALDAASQGSTQWDETTTKTIKSKWMRSYTYSQPVNVTGVVLYHVSRANGAGTGYLTYDYSDNTLQWTAPGGTIGEAVKLSKDGKYQVFSSDKTKWARVVVTPASLPTSDKSDGIAIAVLNGQAYASDIAQKLLNRYRDPVATVSFDVDINNSAWAGRFIKPTDIKDITTDEACIKGANTWVKERVMLTSVRPEKDKVSIEAIQTKMYRRYGFIAPAGTPDYDSATAAQKEYAFIGDANNKVGAALADGYYIW